LERVLGRVIGEVIEGIVLLWWSVDEWAGTDCLVVLILAVPFQGSIG
jgi:hypothetical protein